MATFNNINFTSLGSFNGAAIPAGTGGITELHTWAAAPTGAVDGQYYRMTGTSTVYRYDSGIGILVRPDIYAFSGTKVLDKTIAGTEDGAALNTAGWTVENSGDITSDGTWTSFDSTTNRAGATLSVGSPTQGMYFAGYLLHSSGPGSNYWLGNSVSAENGFFSYTFSTKRKTDSNDPGFTKLSEVYADLKLEGVDNFDLSAAGGAWVEIHVVSGSTVDEQGFAYIGHSESPVRFSGNLTSRTSIGWIAGTPSWASTNHNGIIKIKDCYFARYY